MFQSVILKNTLLLMCLAAVCFWHVRKLNGGCCTSRHLLWKKCFKLFWMSGGQNYCRKVKYIWSTHFHEVISKKLQIGNDNFVFKYPVKCKKILFILNIFIEIEVNLWLLYAQPLISSIIFDTRGPNTQDNVYYALDFYVPADVHFSHFEELKSMFFTSLHFALRVMY